MITQLSTAMHASNLVMSHHADAEYAPFGTFTSSGPQLLPLHFSLPRSPSCLKQCYLLDHTFKLPAEEPAASTQQQLNPTALTERSQHQQRLTSAYSSSHGVRVGLWVRSCLMGGCTSSPATKPDANPAGAWPIGSQAPGGLPQAKPTYR